MAKSYRKKPPSNLICGIQPIKEALRSDKQVDKILIKKGLKADANQELRSAAEEAGVPVQYVPHEKLTALAPGINHQGAVAYLALVTYTDLEDLIISLQDQGKEPLLLMLDNVTDVRNFGAIARSAECMGVDALIIPEQGAARINMDAVKTSAGALNHIGVCRVSNLVDAAMLLQAYQVEITTCTEKAETSLYDSKLTGGRCIVMGAEDKGISNKLRKMANTELRIPLYGEVDSLNVSVAAGIILYEAARQRNS